MQVYPILKMEIKKIFWIFGMILLFSSFAYALELRTAFNPFSGKLDYYRGGNWSGENITVDYLFGNLSWTFLYDYPAACPGGSAITKLGDSVICSTFDHNLLNNLAWSLSLIHI